MSKLSSPNVSSSANQKTSRIGEDQSAVKPAEKTPSQRVAEAFGDKPASNPIQDRIDVAFKPETGMTDSVKSVLTGLGAPAEPTPGEKLAETAQSWVGKDFKPGQEARCADFVSEVVKGSGVDAPDFDPTVRARDFAEMGEKIKSGDLKPGDIVAFNDTYRKSSNPMDHTHVGIYVGEGDMVHRPTKDEPVERVSLEEYLSRPTNDESRERSMVGGYRLTE